MKKIILSIVALILISGLWLAWVLFTPAPRFQSAGKFLYIPSSISGKAEFMRILERDSVVKQPWLFEFVAGKMDYWTSIKPGKYEIKSTENILSIVRKLRSGNQTPVNLVITKIRLKEDLARMVGKRFETDSAQFMAFLNTPDSLSRYNLDTQTVITAVLPNTYTYYWTAKPADIFEKLYREYQRFWNEDRNAKAAALGLSPSEVYTLASIVQEETNLTSEMGNVASVYLNRIKKGMPLQADPTVKFALKDFNLRRIYHKHLAVESPYNTYRNKGLPPGPICTPAVSTIEAVLSAPNTTYLYFAANSKLNGSHVFASSYNEHLTNARLYHKALDSLQKAVGR
ncbi:MAG TPA: endolytic transglycosylase MltG [Parasegetibacter sp.]|jgi:UPF0755 protein